MKRILCLILCISLVSPSPIFGASKVTDGAKCKKENQEAIQNSQHFICKKSSKQLIWRLQSKKTSQNTKVKPTPVKAAPTPLETLYLGIYARYKQSPEAKNPAFNFVRCPSVDPVIASATEKAYIDAYRFWSTVYSSNSRINWLLMGEKDWQCWYDQTEKFEGNPSVSRNWKVWDATSNMLGHCRVSSSSFCGYGTGVLQNGAVAQYNLIGSEYKNMPAPMTVHHETVHIYQAQVVSDNYKTSKINTLPCWFNEGQANFFGIPIAFEGNPDSHRKFEIGRLLKVYPGGRSYSSQEWLQVLKDLSGNFEFCFNNELGYSLGWFAFEWTYLNFSLEQINQLYVDIARGKTWELAVLDTMSMSENAYLAKISEYLAEII